MRPQTMDGRPTELGGRWIERLGPTVTPSRRWGEQQPPDADVASYRNTDSPGFTAQKSAGGHDVNVIGSPGGCESCHGPIGQLADVSVVGQIADVSSDGRAAGDRSSLDGDQSGRETIANAFWRVGDRS